MKKKFLKTFLLGVLLSVFLTGCGLSIYEDWKASGGKAITGGGAIAGKDYVNGLLPSENSRKYFAKLSSANNQPIETVRRSDDQPSKSGVRFVKNGGILIPPGVTISFTNKGYCMDPHLPAPKAGEEYQFVPVTQLIPENLQGIYKKLVQKASAGDESVKRNMQHLIWALRTAGTDAAYANNLTAEQKRILNRCSEYSGQFEEFNANAKANSKILKELLAVADSYLNIKIGGVTYKASDLLDPDIGRKKINEHLNQLIDMSRFLPVERSGFNYGELQKGIYTDVRGSGYLQYNAKIANSTNNEFIFYPSDYVGQVGSGTKSKGFTFFATANTSQRQRVTGGTPEVIEIIDQREPENKDNKGNDENKEPCCTCVIKNSMTQPILKKIKNGYFINVFTNTIQSAGYQALDVYTNGWGGNLLETSLDVIDGLSDEDMLEITHVVAEFGFSQVSDEVLETLQKKIISNTRLQKDLISHGYIPERILRNIKFLRGAGNTLGYIARIKSMLDKMKKDFVSTDRKHFAEILRYCTCKTHNKCKCQIARWYAIMTSNL